MLLWSTIWFSRVNGIHILRQVWQKNVLRKTTGCQSCLLFEKDTINSEGLFLWCQNSAAFINYNLRKWWWRRRRRRHPTKKSFTFYFAYSCQKFPIKNFWSFEKKLLLFWSCDLMEFWALDPIRQITLNYCFLSTILTGCKYKYAICNIKYKNIKMQIFKYKNFSVSFPSTGLVSLKNQTKHSLLHF